MTLAEAITQETRDYLTACRNAGERGASGRPDEANGWLALAHLHLASLKELRHQLVTEHEQLKHCVGC